MTTSFHLPKPNKPKSASASSTASDKAHEHNLTCQKASADAAAVVPKEDDDINSDCPPMYSPSQENSTLPRGKSPFVPKYATSASASTSTSTIVGHYNHDDYDNHETNRTTHGYALQELTRRPATPPPFPTDLPSRTTKDEESNLTPRQKRKRLAIIVGVVSLLLVIIIVTMGVLLAIKMRGETKTVEQQRQQQGGDTKSGVTAPLFPLSTTIVTTTSINTTPLPTPTTTVNEDLIKTILRNLTVTETETETEKVTPTSTAQKSNDLKDPIFFPFPTTTTSTTSTTSFTSPTPTPSQESECNSQETSLTLSPNQCSFIPQTCPNDIAPEEEEGKEKQGQKCYNFCTATFSSNYTISFETSGNLNRVCKDFDSFSEGVDRISSGLGPLKERIRGCCGVCGCFGS